MATAELPAAVKIQDYDPLEGSSIRGGAALGVGLFFIGITAFLCWVAWGDLPDCVSKPSVSPPAFTLFAFGFFGFPGLFLLVRGGLDARQGRQVQEAQAMYPSEPWRWDHVWRSAGAEDIGLSQATKGVIGLSLAVGIVAPLNYIVVAERTPLFAKIGVGLFDAVLILGLGTVIYRIAAQLIHGRGKVGLNQFPLRLGEVADIEILPESRLAGLRQLKVTLKCVQEQFEARRTSRAGSSGTTTTVSTVGYQLFQDERALDAASARSGDGMFHVSFELPDDPDLRTRLCDSPPVYWELVVEGDVPGVDYLKRYLLPVY